MSSLLELPHANLPCSDMSPDLSQAFGPIATILGAHFTDKEIVLGLQRLLKPPVGWMSRVRVRLPACSCCPPEVCLPSLQHCYQCRGLVLLWEPCCERGPRQEGGALALVAQGPCMGCTLFRSQKPENRSRKPENSFPVLWTPELGLGSTVEFM